MRWRALVIAASLLSACRGYHHSDYACASSVVLSPPPGPAPGDAQWLVIERNRQSMGLDQANIGGLALRGPDGDVPLLFHRYFGERFTAVLVVPKNPLTPGTKVTLELREAPSRDNAFAKLSERERTWTVTATSPPPPRWLGAPSIEALRCNWLRRKINDCPPEYVDLRLPVEPAEGTRVRLRVEGGRAGRQEAIFLSRPGDGPHEPAKLLLAERYACGGPLRLTRGTHYRVDVSLLDGSGHEIPAPGGPLEVDGL